MAVICSMQFIPTVNYMSNFQPQSVSWCTQFITLLWGRGERRTKSIGHSTSTKTANFYDMDMGLKKGETAYKNGAGKKLRQTLM
jgi:hypothetical protein